MAQLEPADIYARHRQGLFTHALSITGCPARAEDAVHDAFANVCRDAARDVADPVAYVFAAVRSAALLHLRKAKRAHEVMNDVATQTSIFQPQGDADGPALSDERVREVAQALEVLPADYREAVVLRIYAGLTFAQIAAVTDAPVPTVVARYRRSLERLRSRLEKLV